MLKEVLAAQAEEILAGGAIGMSPRLRELFVYLRDTTLAGTPVKEFDIAHEVFGRDASFNAVQDASVRVHVHRLRRKLEEYYEGRPGMGARLAIPKGEYRLALIEPATEPDPVLSPLPPAHDPRRMPPAAWIVPLAIVALLVASVGGYLFGRRSDIDARADRALASSLWSGLRGRPGVPLLVVGDYYIFGNGTPTGVESLTRRFDVNSGEDLLRVIDAEKVPPGRYVDLNLYYLPLAAAWAVRDVLPILHGLASGDRYAPIVTMSQLQPQMIKTSDLVYVGYLSGLGRLQNPVFAGSRLMIGGTYDELVDLRSGHHYNASYDRPGQPQQIHREFAYLSTFPGPDGHRIIVIAGSRDAGLIQASAIARDPDMLADLQRRLGNVQNFEALFEVEAAGVVPFRTRRLLLAPLDTSRPWRDLVG